MHSGVFISLNGQFHLLNMDKSISSSHKLDNTLKMLTNSSYLDSSREQSEKELFCMRRNNLRRIHLFVCAHLFSARVKRLPL